MMSLFFMTTGTKALKVHLQIAPIPSSIPGMFFLFRPKYILCQDPYFHTLTNGRQHNVMLDSLLARCLILLCSLGLALGLRPLLSSLAQAILTCIQNVSVVLPLGLCNSVLSSLGGRLGCL
jgi:hypothetical protein